MVYGREGAVGSTMGGRKLGQVVRLKMSVCREGQESWHMWVGFHGSMKYPWMRSTSVPLTDD